MSLEELKAEAAELPVEQQHELAVHLASLSNHRESQVTTGRQLAAALREWKEQLSQQEHLEIADEIEQARRRMNDEHLR